MTPAEAAATIHLNVGHIARGCRSEMYHDPTRYMNQVF